MTDSPAESAASDAAQDFGPRWFLAQAVPFLLLAAGAVFLAASWEQIPDPWISHWNGSFEPDGRSEKSPEKLALPLLLGAFSCLVLLVVQVAILRAKDRPGRRSGRARKRATAYILWITEIFLAALFAVICQAPLVQTPGGAKLFVVLVLVFCLVGSLALTIWAIVYGKKHWGDDDWDDELDDLGGEPAEPSMRRENWRLGGQIYFAPDDPTLMVEKRFGIGYTFNFARPAAWWILGALILGPLLIVWLVVSL